MFASCTKNVKIKIPPPESQLVVEGYIENGKSPFVFLTTNSPFYDTIKLNEIGKYFVSGATVIVSDGVSVDTLLQFNYDTMGTQIPIYISLPPPFGHGIIGQTNHTYTLDVYANGKHLSSVTTIRDLNPLDSIWVKTNVDPHNDSLVQLFCKYADPPALGDYIRYFTRVNNQPFYPGEESVFEDVLINGTTFTFPLDRGVDWNNDATYKHYGLFYKGDTVTVEWAHIDRPHFDFWRTFEFERNGAGNPFSSPVKVKSNIVGGLGIWGGYAASYKTIIIPQ